MHFKTLLTAFLVVLGGSGILLFRGGDGAVAQDGGQQDGGQQDGGQQDGKVEKTPSEDELPDLEDDLPDVGKPDVRKDAKAPTAKNSVPAKGATQKPVPKPGDSSKGPAKDPLKGPAKSPAKQPAAKPGPAEEDAPLRRIPQPGQEKKTAKGDAADSAGNGSTEKSVPTENTVLRDREFPPIVAVVGDSSISRKNFLQEYQRRLEEYRVVLSSQVQPVDTRFVARQVLSDLVHNELLAQAARRRAGGRELVEIVPHDKVLLEIDRRVEELKTRGYREFSSREDYFTNQLKRFGQTREQVLESIRQHILVNSFLWQEVFHEMDRFVSPSESRSYYRSHLDDFTKPLGYSFRRIQFQDGFNTNEMVKKIKDALDQGESFVDVAKKYSEEFSNERLRGKKWEKTYEEVQGMPFPFPQIIQRMKPGEVSPPRKVQGQVVFVRLESVRTGDPLPYVKAQPKIEKELISRRHRASTEALLRRLREHARVESYIPGVVLDEEKKNGSPKVSSAAENSAPAGASGGSSD